MEAREKGGVVLKPSQHDGQHNKDDKHQRSDDPDPLQIRRYIFALRDAGDSGRRRNRELRSSNLKGGGWPGS